jgi:hypothetical protein
VGCFGSAGLHIAGVIDSRGLGGGRWKLDKAEDRSRRRLRLKLDYKQIVQTNTLAPTDITTEKGSSAAAGGASEKLKLAHLARADPSKGIMSREEDDEEDAAGGELGVGTQPSSVTIAALRPFT